MLSIKHFENPLKDHDGDYFVFKITTNLRIDCKKLASLLVKNFSQYFLITNDSQIGPLLIFGF